jgi:malonyl-CoA decarboxylase
MPATMPGVAGRTWLDHVGHIAERGREILSRSGQGRRLQSVEALCRRLLSQRGEASSIALASDLVAVIHRMDGGETAGFLGMLATGFSPDPQRLTAAIERWQREPDRDSLQELITTVEPPRQELFRRLNSAPGGTRAIVDLRAALLDLLPSRPELEAVDADLRHLLSSWFNRGFLHLEQISWQTSAAILERLIEYEAVHEIRGWDDLRRRLGSDRRCFAFFHPALPDEPLIFVEVGLTRGLATAIAPLIDPTREEADPADADTAIFFSISNTQRGLRGVSFGNFLIKQVVTELTLQLPNLRRFATLSPLPRLAATLARRGDPDGFTAGRLSALLEPDATALLRLTGEEEVVPALATLLAQPRPYPPEVDRALERLALAYLVCVRRGERTRDPVAHFHLSNGARLERINPGGDVSPGGAESCGVMVNYLYEPSQLEINHERYVESGEVVTARHLAARARRVEAIWKRGDATS